MLALMLVGLWLALDFPLTEEPPVTIRTATVLSMAPGANVERMEQLIARPTEESILGLPEVKRVKTTVSPGFAFTYVELDAAVPPARPHEVWQRLRTRMNQLQPQGACRHAAGPAGGRRVWPRGRAHPGPDRPRLPGG